MNHSFQPGDILIAATDVDDRNVDLRNHSGAGRVLHYDRALQLRGELRTGQTGLVVGLGIDPTDRSLYACDPGSQTVTRFDRDGACTGVVELLPRARIGSILFLPDGRFVAGLHSKIGEPAETPAPRLYMGSMRERRIEPLAVEIDGGKFGFHCVTHLALAADLRTLHYVSEGGRRLMRYDLEARQQLPDLLRLEKSDPRGTFGPSVLADGRVLMATGSGAVLLDADGTELRSDLPAVAKGWSRLTLALDQQAYYLGNFLDGLLEKRDVASGALLLTHDIHRKFSLSGLAEVPAA
jgi:sugar lactone lactonase YvrE